jgi:uncharacterized membrane protein
VSPVAFLLIAVIIAAIGTMVVVVVNRSPSRPDSAMTEFQREMRALAPRPSAETPPRRSGTDESDSGDDETRSDPVSDER